MRIDLSGYDPKFMDYYKTQVGGSLREWLKNLPGVYKQWQQDQQIAGAKTPPGQNLGRNFDYLSDILKKNITNGLDMTKYKQNAAGFIGKATNRRLKETQENLNASGLSRAGVGYSVANDIYGQEADALAGVENNLINQEIGFKTNAVNQLLGLNSFEGGQNLATTSGDRNYEMALRGFFENQRQFKEQMDNQPAWWESILGSLLGGGAQIGAAALTSGGSAAGGAAAMAMSDKKVKKDIKYTGEKTKDGIPIATFRYKDDKSNKLYKGVIAQDVEKINPEAVVKAVDYSKLPDAIFQEV